MVVFYFILCFVLFCVLFLLLYIAVSFLFLYKFTDHCHWVVTQFFFSLLALQHPLGVVFYSPLVGFSLLACEVF